MTDTTRESVEGHQHWRVTVETGNEQIVCIETECLSGREPSPADEQAIRTAAHHLLAFLGDDTPEYIPVLLTRAEAAEAARDALQAKLAVAVEALQKLHHAVCGETGFAECVRRDIGKAYPWPALDIADDLAQSALATLTADTPPDPRIEGWNAAIEAAAEIYEGTFDALARLIRTIPCPYTPKEGEDDDQ